MPIRWTPPAARDLTQIADYIQEKDGPAPARRVALAIHEAVSRLSRFPQLGRPGKKAGTRELVIAGLPYLAVYRVHENVVELLRILHGAQRWP
jgi:addiction module RelE/StbE family toxin